MDRARLAGIVVVAIIYVFLSYPIPAIVMSLVAIVCYFAFRHFTIQNGYDRGRRERREAALLKAGVHLGYYSDIWSNLRLSNDFCYLTLGADGESITGFEKISDSSVLRTFKVVKSNVHDWEEVWNMFCMGFSYNKTYDGLKEDCRKFKLVIEEKALELPKKNHPERKSETKVVKKKVDINNCSENEMQELPGVSVIMAKKALKRREEIGGFKSVQEFFDFLKIKPNLQEQLNDLVIANEIKGLKKVKRYNERNVDL